MPVRWETITIHAGQGKGCTPCFSDVHTHTLHIESQHGKSGTSLSSLLQDLCIWMWHAICHLEGESIPVTMKKVPCCLTRNASWYPQISLFPDFCSCASSHVLKEAECDVCAIKYNVSMIEMAALHTPCACNRDPEMLVVCCVQNNI